MSQAAQTAEKPQIKEKPKSEPQFTGVARSVEAFDNQGFRNFRILTLHIKDGKVIKTDRSDAYANFECIARMEIWNEMSIIHLNNTWQNGKTLSK